MWLNWVQHNLCKFISFLDQVFLELGKFGTVKWIEIGTRSSSLFIYVQRLGANAKIDPDTSINQGNIS
jgi:hypothetical protein